MKNKVVLITGTNSGFGWLTATSCAALGHKVYATMRDTKGRNAEKAKALTRQANIEVLDVELTSGKSVNDAIATIIKKEARLDVVVNNAGIYAVGIAETFTEEDLAKVMDVNVQGPWRIIRAALPQMRKQGEGLIINISSVAGRFAFPFQTPYDVSKFAVEGLTEGLHYEVRPMGVDVVMVQPGAFPTDIWGKILNGSDATVISGYGDLARVPAQIGAGIGQMFEALKPNPQLIADAIVNLMDTPIGKRPLRTVVDPATGGFSEKANQQVKEQYENFLTAFGMGSMLKASDFTTTFLVDQTPTEVFNAIKNVRGWWSGEIKGETDKPGAEFTYEVPGAHYSKQKITEFIPGKKVVWLVLDATLSFVENKSEWKNTEIIFEITKKGARTEVRFTHKGLVPAFQCYDGVSNAWGLLVNGNLRKLIITGQVQPSPW